MEIALGKPAYVTAIDPESNTVVLGDEEDLAQQTMIVTKLNWLKYDAVKDGMLVQTKIRYKDRGADSYLYHDGQNIVVRFTRTGEEYRTRSKCRFL